MRDISIEDALALEAVFIDLRAPKEYGEDRIPGAINIPLFSDEQRHIVGCVHKNEGSTRAKEVGLEFVAPQLPRLVREIAAHVDNNPVVLYCWRGGLRSKAMAQILNIMHVPHYRLQGGYKAYRRHVNAFFAKEMPFRTAVLHGMTGTGKTEIIKELQSMGFPAVDLEGLANNRGSVFGWVGLGEQPGQKRFESLLFDALRKIPPNATVAVEGESKRIGKNFIPDSFFTAMEQGTKIEVADTLSHRRARIIDEYSDHSQENLEALKQSISLLAKRLGKNKTKELMGMVTAGNLDDVVEYLLINYYDPLYSKPNHEYAFSVSGSHPPEAAAALISFLSSS